jgi:hypothetical protein
MKYWVFFAAKLAVAGTILFSVWVGIRFVFWSPQPFLTIYQEPFARDLWWTTLVMLYWLLCIGVLYLIILDQQYRCRSCLRRLRMPVAAGSWTHILLFGPPRTEYICAYGHGTLKVPELQISGKEKPDWKPIDDMWKELTGLEETRK